MATHVVSARCYVAPNQLARCKKRAAGAAMEKSTPSNMRIIAVAVTRAVLTNHPRRSTGAAGSGSINIGARGGGSRSSKLLRGTIVNRTYGIYKNLYV